MTDQLPNVPGLPHLRTIAMPRETNAGGDIFGGWTLS
jgi:acyl-CoA thioesterase YciA